jgi:predicted RNA-binding Zn ribbon-like protein
MVPKRKRGTYEASNMSKDLREAIPLLYEGMRSKGLAHGDAIDVLVNAKCAVPARSLRRWRVKTATGGKLFTGASGAGAPAKLSAAQLEVLAGRVLTVNECTE